MSGKLMAVQGRPHRAGGTTTAVTAGISQWVKSCGTPGEGSEEATVPMIARTTQPCVGKGLCFSRAKRGDA
jgi:hypothetical protein